MTIEQKAKIKGIALCLLLILANMRLNAQTDTIYTQTETIYCDNDGLIWAVSLPNSAEDLKDAQENITALAKLAGDNSVSVIIDIRLQKSISKAALDYYYKDKAVAAFIKAYAIIQPSGLQAFFANIMLKLFVKPLMPTKSFSSEKKAKEWLEKQ